MSSNAVVDRDIECWENAVTPIRFAVNVFVPGFVPVSTHPTSDVNHVWPQLPFKNHAVHPSASGFAGLLYHQKWFLDTILRECGSAQPMLVLYRWRLARSGTHFTAKRLVLSSGPAASIFRLLFQSFCPVGYNPWGDFWELGSVALGTVGVVKGKRKIGNGQIKQENSVENSDSKNTLTPWIFEVSVPVDPGVEPLG